MFKLLFLQALKTFGKYLPIRLRVIHSDDTVQIVGKEGADAVTLVIKSPEAYRRLVSNAPLGFPELYTEEKLMVESPAGTDGLFALLRAFYAVGKESLLPGSWGWDWLKRKLQAQNNPPSESLLNVRDHYDANDEIVRMITGVTKQYSCAFFARPHWTLDAAQYGKMDLLLAKLRLRLGQRLLDIGCGYGGLIRRAAEKFGVETLGVTLSREQEQVGNRMTGEAGLENRCRIRLADYRGLPGIFDRVVSVGMFEHVGAKAWKEYFRKIDSLLAPNGIFVLHTICLLRPYPMNPFIRRHIFPGAELPAIAEVLRAAQNTYLRCRHFENLQSHYAKTCLAWLGNLREKRDAIIARHGNWRYRAFEVYLAGGAASFSVPSGMQLGQFVFTKGNANWPASTEFMTEWLSGHP